MSVLLLSKQTRYLGFPPCENFPRISEWLSGLESILRVPLYRSIGQDDVSSVVKLSRKQTDRTPYEMLAFSPFLQYNLSTVDMSPWLIVVTFIHFNS